MGVDGSQESPEWMCIIDMDTPMLRTNISSPWEWQNLPWADSEEWGKNPSLGPSANVDNLPRIYPPQLSPQDVYILKLAPLQRWLLLRLAKPASLFDCIL